LISLRHTLELIQNAHAALVEIALDAAPARALGEIRLGAILAAEKPAREREIAERAQTIAHA